MAGGFGFLPLSGKPSVMSLNANTNAGDAPDANKGKKTPAPAQNGKENQDHDASLELEVTETGDDEWYDTATSSSDASPVTTKFADGESSVVTVRPPPPAEEAALLPYMPALFGTDLPPCNAELQVAYEIVCNKLRQRWLNHRGRLSAVDITQAVHSDLRDQNRMWPPFSVKGKFKRRRPWCRETVFKWQLRWIEYFVREATAQAAAASDPELLTESEIMDRRKHSAVPRELQLNVVKRDVLKLWDEWNDKRRKRSPVLPGVATGEGLGAPLPDGAVESYTNGKGNSSEETVVPPHAKQPADDAHMWSDGGHD